MSDCEQNQPIRATSYIRSLMPNVNVSESAINGILIDAGIGGDIPVTELTEKNKDLALAYLLIRIVFSPSSSKTVTDRDADWEHTESGEQWSSDQLVQYLKLARALLEKWGIKDERIESLLPKWGMKGTGFHKIRRYK